MTGAATNPLHAGHYPDRATSRRARVLANVKLARDTYRLRLDCPEVAQQFVPGQFVMIRLAASTDPLLGRPMAVYNTVVEADGRLSGIDVVYHVVGRMTARLAALEPPSELIVWGPLGNGFALGPARHLIMVAGGIGQTPFLALALEALGSRVYGRPPRDAAKADRVTLCYGVRTRATLACVDDFRQVGVEVRISSDDGSVGHAGLVTELLDEILMGSPAACRVVCCGPVPMMRVVAARTAAADVPCQVSLETPMACGIGICFSCVVKVRLADGSWDYKRTCVEGPVFDAQRIVW